jgi:hypothetical protein
LNLTTNITHTTNTTHNNHTTHTTHTTHTDHTTHTTPFPKNNKPPTLLRLPTPHTPQDKRCKCKHP